MSDIIVETRIPLEDFYKALMYMKQSGAFPKHRSTVASQSVKLVASLYEGDVPPIEEMISLIKKEFNINLSGGFTQSGRSAISTAFKKRMQEEAKTDGEGTSLEDLMKGILNRGGV